MSIPYHQYVDYSNPATPPSSTSDQDPALQFPPQDSQQHQQQQQQISPSQLQLQQLPPPMPPQQHQQHTTSPQEHSHQLQQHQQHHQHQQQQQQAQVQVQGLGQFSITPQHQTIQVVPSAGQPQYRFETVTEEDFIHASATGERLPGTSSRRRGASKPPSLHVDTSRASSSSAAAAASPSALSSAGAGPLRVPHSRPHVVQQPGHPYRRPQSRAASGGSGGAQAAPVRSRRVSELQSLSQTPQTSAGGAMSMSMSMMSVPTSASTSALPAVGTAMAVNCPASNAWRDGLLGLTSFDPAATPTTTGGMPQPVRRYAIRADVHYGSEENVMTAMFELPGVKRSDLRVTMSVCPFSRVRQVTVSGLARAVLPVQGHSVRERKFGEFFRTLPVPPDTRPEDVVVSLEDGILTLKIPCGTPAQAEPPQDIPIP
ncbi:hypothetical protein C8Q76DRAFT_769319 [Earliella scabrosa]|nr:hypothetical protein C8Q76DRAFT_769319 [Earliella scabrosa]